MANNYLLPSIHYLLEMDDATRIEHIQKDQWIGYPRAHQALEKLNNLFIHPKRTRMPNLLIVAPTNNGKTMIINKFFRERFPERANGLVNEDELLLEAPVINMQMPSGPELKRFYLALLEKIDAFHGRSKTSLVSFEQDVYRMMKREVGWKSRPIF